MTKKNSPELKTTYSSVSDILNTAIKERFENAELRAAQVEGEYLDNVGKVSDATIQRYQNQITKASVSMMPDLNNLKIKTVD